MSRFLQEFWWHGYNRRAPGFTLGLARIAMGLFWLAQLSGRPFSVWGALSAVAGISLTLGLVAKVGAALGVMLSVLQALLYAASAGAELWPYGLLVLVHIVLLATRSGQNLGLDQLIEEKIANAAQRQARWVFLLRLLV